MSSTASSPVSSTSNGARATPAAARRQRVLWDSDNATRGGKTSIGVLLDWLTAPGNYARWRDGKSQSGETREMLCTEIKGNMYREGIHHRENANIRTQISELERSYEAARVWLEDNGCDPNTLERRADADAPELETALGGGRNRVESHVLRMCRYYHVLHEVFGKDDLKGRSRRPYHRSLTGVKKQKFEEAIVTEQPVEMDVEEEATRVPLSLPSVAAVPATNISAASTPVPVPVSAGLTGNWNSPAALANYESTQRLLTEAVREEREKKRFAMEEERNKLECEKLRYEVEAAKLQLTIDRALARKKLLDAGLPESQVDEIFPK